MDQLKLADHLAVELKWSPMIVFEWPLSLFLTFIQKQWYLLSWDSKQCMKEHMRLGVTKNRIEQLYLALKMFLKVLFIIRPPSFQLEERKTKRL